MKRLVFSIMFLAAAFFVAPDARAATCPTDNGAGVVCSGGTPYYCNASCRTVAGPPDLAHCSVYVPNSCVQTSTCTNCATTDCGYCATCATNYAACGSWPDRTCVYNNPTDHCASLYNCTTGQCATCTTGYTVCNTTHVCVATQSCPSGQTYNGCTLACEGDLTVLKLSYDSTSPSSAAGTAIKQSATGALSIVSSGNVGIGTTAPNAKLEINPAIGYAILAGSSTSTAYRIGNVSTPIDDFDAATKSYVDALGAGASLWGGAAGSNIWNLNTDYNVGIGTTNPLSSLDIQGSLNRLLAVKRTGVFDFVQYQRAAGTWTDVTLEAGKSKGYVTGDVLDAINDVFVMGKTDIFSSIYIDIGTARSSTGGTFVWEYWDGSSWAALSVTDGTSALYTDGIVSFTSPVDWATTTLNGSAQLYFVRLRFSAGTISTEPTIYLAVPNTGLNVAEMFANGNDTAPSFSIDPQGNIRLGEIGAATTLGGSLSVSSTLSVYSYIAHSKSSGMVLTSADGLVMSSSAAATTANPVNYSPRLRFATTVWDTGTAASVSQNWKSEIIPFIGNPSTSKMTWEYGYNGATDTIFKQIMNLESEGNLNVLGSNSGSESLTNGSLTAASGVWGVANGFIIGTNYATYTHNASGGTLTQTSANLAVQLKANTWYRLTYTTSSNVAGVNLYLDTDVAYKKIYLQGGAVAGTYDAVFKTSSAPTDFVIRAESTAGSLRLDNLSLTEKTGGNLTATGNGYFSGNVGIGTVAPNAKLEINPAIGYAILAGSSTSTAYRIGNVSAPIDDFDAATKSYVDSVAPGGSLSLWNGTQDGNIWNGTNGAGNVGIGTTNPVALLQVGGVTSSFYSLVPGKANFNSSNINLSETAMGTINISSDSKTDGSNVGYGPSITFSQNVSQYVAGYEKVIAGLKAYLTSTGNTNENSSLGFFTHDGGSLSERMTIGYSGNVGIGTTAAAAKLNVSNGGAEGVEFFPGYSSNLSIVQLYNRSTSAYNDLQINTKSGGSMLVQAITGNVGIGTTAPYQKLEVNGIIGSGNTTDGIFMFLSGTTGTILGRNTSNTEYNDLSFRAGGPTQLYLNTSGNVGIGTTAPQANLDIAPTGAAVLRVHSKTNSSSVASLELIRGASTTTFGSGTYGQYRLRNESARLYFDYGINDDFTTPLAISSVGRVGIGTTAPAVQLQIGGVESGSYSILAELATTTARRIGNIDTPTNDNDAATKAYVDVAAADSGAAVYAGATASTYTGNRGGYTAANALCNTVGSHVCTSGEILATINNGLGSSLPANTTMWISNGPPAYTANANDCQGWTVGTSASYGTIWNKATSGDGYGSLDNCAQAYKFACCL